jgi:RNA polymerase sigma factor (sigma-70 family)
MLIRSTWKLLENRNECLAVIAPHSSGKKMLLELATVETNPTKVQAAPIKVADYLFLAAVIAHKFRNKKKYEKIEDSEPYSIACEELVKAAVGFDPAVQGDFSRYAYRAMLNGVIEHIRHKKAKKRTATFENISEKDFRSIPEKGEGTPDTLPVDLLKTLLADDGTDTEQDRDDKALLTEIYLAGKKIPVIAEQYGISRVTVYNRLRRILGKIRQRHAELVEKYGGFVDERPDQHEGKPCDLHRRGEG